MIKDFDLIIFDWDGTLMDSTGHIVHCLQQASADLNLAVPSKTRAAHVIGLGLVEAMEYLHPNLSQSNYQAMVDAYRKHYFLDEKKLDLFEGVFESLHALHQRGVTLAVATGKSRAGLNKLLHESKLDAIISASRTVDECHSKPHPQMILEILAQTGHCAERTLMVGDTSHDLNMANAAKVASFALSYGAHSVAELEACHPRAIFADFHSLHATLMGEFQ